MRNPPIMNVCYEPSCTKKLLSLRYWKPADADQRAQWAADGYARHETRGLCKAHSSLKDTYGQSRRKIYGTRTPGNLGTNEERRAESARRKRRIAGMYHSLVKQDWRDPIGEIAHEMSLSPVSVQKYLRASGVAYPARNPRRDHRLYVVEEVAHFRSLGRGLHEIASKLGYTDEQLAASLRAWHVDGVVPYDLEWLDRSDMKSQNKKLTTF
jgi:hypothetical protein